VVHVAVFKELEDNKKPDHATAGAHLPLRQHPDARVNPVTGHRSPKLGFRTAATLPLGCNTCSSVAAQGGIPAAVPVRMRALEIRPRRWENDVQGRAPAARRHARHIARQGGADFVCRENCGQNGRQECLPTNTIRPSHSRGADTSGPIHLPQRSGHRHSVVLLQHGLRQFDAGLLKLFDDAKIDPLSVVRIAGSVAGAYQYVTVSRKALRLDVLEVHQRGSDVVDDRRTGRVSFLLENAAEARMASRSLSLGAWPSISSVTMRRTAGRRLRFSIGFVIRLALGSSPGDRRPYEPSSIGTRCLDRPS